LRGSGSAEDAGDVVTEALVLDCGIITVSDGPGFGFAIDPDAVKRLRVADRP
jgi:L-alanine-DL-glutamate epimerase-like enolase superfamily enzyme